MDRQCCCSVVARRNTIMCWNVQQLPRYHERRPIEAACAAAVGFWVCMLFATYLLLLFLQQPLSPKEVSWTFLLLSQLFFPSLS